MPIKVEVKEGNYDANSGIEIDKAALKTLIKDDLEALKTETDEAKKAAAISDIFNEFFVSRKEVAELDDEYHLFFEFKGQTYRLDQKFNIDNLGDSTAGDTDIEDFFNDLRDWALQWSELNATSAEAKMEMTHSLNIALIDLKDEVIETAVRPADQLLSQAS